MTPATGGWQLFDPSRTSPAACPVCGATRQPHEQKAPACTVDRDRNAGVHPYPRRPAGCLNQIDNQRTEIPY